MFATMSTSLPLTATSDEPGRLGTPTALIRTAGSMARFAALATSSCSTRRISSALLRLRRTAGNERERPRQWLTISCRTERPPTAAGC
jgi:hypothetical protein